MPIQRTVIALISTCLWAGSAPAQRPLFVNAQTLGAKPGTDCTHAAQLAVDAMAARLRQVHPGVATKVVVYFPADVHAYQLSRSIMVDSDYVEIQGDGNGTRFESVPGTAFPHFVFGIRRWPVDTAASKAAYLAYRPDLFGRLDASAASARGQRWGWSSRGDSFLMAVASPFNAGQTMLGGSWDVDNWTKGQALTIEFAIDGDGPIPTDFIFAIGALAKPTPFMVYADGPDHMVVLIGTQDAPGGPVTRRRFDFIVPPAAAKRLPRRVVIQVDLAAGKYAAFVDGRVAQNNLNHMNLTPSATRRFAENDYCPLLIGDGGSARPTWAVRGAKFDLLGFAVSRSLRYAWGARGDAQTRLDGKAIDDAYRYFTRRGDDPGHLASLAFTDDPATCPRQLTVQATPGSANITSGAWLLHAPMLGAGTMNISQGIRDVQMMGGKLYGSNLALGQVLKFRAIGVRSRETYYGLSSMGFGAIYPLKLTDLELDGQDAAVFLESSIATIRDVHVNGAGRATYRFSGCNIDLSHSMTAFTSNNPQAAVMIHGGDYGGQYRIDDFMADNKGSFYTRAAIFAEANPYGQTTLRITDCYLGTTGGADVPIIKLTAPHRLNSWAATLIVDHIEALSVAGKALVDSDGWWRGSVVNSPSVNPLLKGGHITFAQPGPQEAVPAPTTPAPEKGTGPKKSAEKGKF